MRSPSNPSLAESRTAHGCGQPWHEIWLNPWESSAGGGLFETLERPAMGHLGHRRHAVD